MEEATNEIKAGCDRPINQEATCFLHFFPKRCPRLNTKEIPLCVFFTLWLSQESKRQQQQQQKQQQQQTLLCLKEVCFFVCVLYKTIIYNITKQVFFYSSITIKFVAISIGVATL